MSDRTALADRLAALAPLDVPDAYAEGVTQSLAILAEHIARFIEIDLPDATEPAPVFRA